MIESDSDKEQQQEKVSNAIREQTKVAYSLISGYLVHQVSFLCGTQTQRRSHSCSYF